MPRANERVADLLQEYADLVSIRGGEAFKVRAYERASRAVREHGGDVTAMGAKELASIAGVGKSIAEKIGEFASTGAIRDVAALRAEIPAGVRELMVVPGLGPRRAFVLHSEMGIGSPRELRQALVDGRLRGVKGFGERTERNLLEALDRRKKAAGDRVPLPTALAVAEEIVDALSSSPGVARASYAGSLRRMCEAIGDVDVLVATTDPAAAVEAFTSLSIVERVRSSGATKSSILTTNGVQVDMRVIAPGVWGAALQYFTGSKAHNVRVREHAVRKGLKLSEYGLFTASDDRLIVAGTEEEVYERLGMQWIPPTLRENRGEVEAALRGELPHLLDMSDIRGDLQAHTTYSDGRSTLREMALAAVRKRYRYLAVTDHGRRLSMAGMSVEDVARQRADVAEVRSELGGKLALLHGLEANVGGDGDLDYPDEVLAQFDFVIASVHHQLNLDREAMTRRVLRAVEHPRVRILGHPTGRRIDRDRPGYELDFDAVFAACARHGVAVEIDGHPGRLDLNDEHVLWARRHGVVFAVDTDAHHVRELDNMRFGVAMAQRGWVRRDEVINTQPVQRLRSFLGGKRR